jgi:WXXGXW repeat (2 copies)
MTLRIIFAPLAAVLALTALVGSNPSAPAAPDGPAGDADIAVQARGPIHEGYAQPFTAPKAGPVVPKAPPDPVPELPPDEKPEGDNVQWVPGYWSWDADRNDYLWVSGFWRAAPPDRKWVAGYWRKADDGWQWVGGYWAPKSQERPPLLDTPPAPPETGPSVPAPDDRSLYVPGSWMWRDERYAWRPGFWRPARLGWVWVPAHYVWTPGGCVFVDGYWDYPLETRGVLFAPVVFTRPLWRTPGWCYRPRFVVNVDTSFFAALFVRPSCGQYCFGDYYDPACLAAGYQPWCQFGARHHDPLFSYYRWSHRDDPAWLRGVGAVYAGRRAGDLARPPHTLAEQTTAGRRVGPAVVQPLSDFRGGLKLAAIDRTQVARHQAAAQQIQEGARQRVQVERSGTHSRSDAPVIVNQPVDRGAPHHHEVHAAAPVVEHAAHTKAPAPVIVNKSAAPAPPPSRPAVVAPQRHVSPPHQAPAHHESPPAHHATPAPAHSNAGHAGHSNAGHKKK